MNLAVTPGRLMGVGYGAETGKQEIRSYPSWLRGLRSPDGKVWVMGYSKLQTNSNVLGAAV